ncbi:MAG: DUF4938 domain-containing protein [Chloroflexaceae bacterium]|nr:DUF4938 domain-containing protein [Chloroflexaceae bacterium]
MTAPIKLVHLFAYGGPNIRGPQSGVLLRVRCPTDRSRRIRDALKDGAQFIGLVIAYLDVQATPAEDGYLITASFSTPLPAIGRDLAAYVVEGIRALATGDDEWDKDTPLFALQQQRRQLAHSIPVLQLLAEAHRRALPVLDLPDSVLQLGYGIHGWRYVPSEQPAPSDDDDPPLQPPRIAVPWEQIGRVPLYVVTGEYDRPAMVQQLAHQLDAAAQGYTVHPHASYNTVLHILADPTTRGAVVGLHTADIVQRGVPFDRCTACIITDAAGTPPPEALDATEWVQALGLPMLLTAGAVLLNMDDPRLAALHDYAPPGILSLDRLDSIKPLSPPS